MLSLVSLYCFLFLVSLHSLTNADGSAAATTAGACVQAAMRAIARCTMLFDSVLR